MSHPLPATADRAGRGGAGCGEERRKGEGKDACHFDLSLQLLSENPIKMTGKKMIDDNLDEYIFNDIIEKVLHFFFYLPPKRCRRTFRRAEFAIYRECIVTPIPPEEILLKFQAR